MYISVPKLNAPFLQHLSNDLVATFFGIPLEKEEAISTGIYMAKPVGRSCSEKLEMVDFCAYGCCVVVVDVIGGAGTFEATCCDDSKGRYDL